MRESCAVGEELLYHALKVSDVADKKENLTTHLSTSLSPQSYVNESLRISTPMTKTCLVLLLDHCSNIKKISNVRPTAVEIRQM